MCSAQSRARKVWPQRYGRRRTGCFVRPRYWRRLLPATRETPCLSLASFLGHPCERSEEHTSELQSLMRISYAVFCLKKKKKSLSTIENNTTKSSCLSVKTIN